MEGFRVRSLSNVDLLIYLFMIIIMWYFGEEKSIYAREALGL